MPAALEGCSPIAVSTGEGRPWCWEGADGMEEAEEGRLREKVEWCEGDERTVETERVPCDRGGDGGEECVVVERGGDGLAFRLAEGRMGSKLSLHSGLRRRDMVQQRVWNVLTVCRWKRRR